MNSALCQFVGPDGSFAGPTVELPFASTKQQLVELLNQFIPSSENVILPYAFFIEDVEIVTELGDVVSKEHVSTEKTILIRYQPQAIFHVRAVSRCTSTLPGHSEAVLFVSFSPDAKFAASGSGDATVRTWNMQSQLPENTLRGHSDWVLCLAWSPDGKFLASGSKDGNVCIWPGAKQEDMRKFQGHKKWITSLAWQPLHSTQDGDCRLLASGSKDGSIRVWDVFQGHTIFILTGHTSGVTCVKWGGQGFIYTASQDRTIKVWDAKDGKQVRSLDGHGHWVNTMALNSDYVLRTGAYDHTCKLSTTEPLELKEIARKRYVEVTKNEPERLVSGSDDFTLYLWEPTKSSKSIARMTGHQQLVNSVSFSHDQIFIASASFDKSVRIWMASTGKFVATLRGHVGAVYMVCFSPDSRLVLTASKDSTMKVWDVKTRKLKEDLPGHADEVYAIDWSPDGSWVMSGGKDKNLKVWHH